jgi:hypothetical protein
MTDETATAAPANSAFRVLAAIADLGEATAAAVAEEADLAYSTVTPKLRAWEAAGQAEKYYNQDKSQTLWRLTEAGKTATATPAHHSGTPPTGGGATAGAATAKPTKGKGRTTAAAEPDHERLAEGDEPTAAEPVHRDDAATVIAPETADPGTDETEQATDTSRAAAPAADPPPTAAPADDQPRPADTATGIDAVGRPAKRRRPAGAVEATALAVLRANPDTEYKVGHMMKAIDEADAGTGYPRVSGGATTNALDKLAGQNKAMRVEGRTAATYTLAPTTD